MHKISTEFSCLSGIYGKALIKIMEYIVSHRALFVFLGTYISVVYLPDTVQWFQRGGIEWSFTDFLHGEKEWPDVEFFHSTFSPDSLCK